MKKLWLPLKLNVISREQRHVLIRTVNSEEKAYAEQTLPTEGRPTCYAQ